MVTEVLDAVNETKKWYLVLEELPTDLVDVYFYPEWVMLHRFNPGSRALMFTFQKQGKIWAYPFLLSPISFPDQSSFEKTWHDIETAYGYGGPVANTKDKDFLEDAHNAFISWCHKQNVVAEFVRFHPLIQNEQWIDSDVKITFDRETVYLNFALLKNDELPFTSKTRNMLNRAENLGVSIVRLEGRSGYKKFVDMYSNSMKRLKAETYLLFNNEYFSNLYSILQNGGLILGAEQKNTCIAAAVFIKGTRWLHYHLAATCFEKMVPGANNKLLLTASQIGFGLGLKGLHLGGGRTNLPDDTLLKFKRSMSTSSYNYVIGKRIHNHDIYSRLYNAWKNQYPLLENEYGDRLLCYRYMT